MVETPKWLDCAFMEKVLRKEENNNMVKVINMNTKPATNKGDNYTSDMIRVVTEYTCDQGGCKTKKKISLIVKITPIDEGIRKDLITQSGLFETEIVMMSNTLLKMNKLLPGHPLSAKCLYVEQGDPTLLVLEDLAPQFRMGDREAGLDLNHCTLAIRGLARFHAASVAVVEKEPAQKELYTIGIFHEKYPAEMTGFFIQGTKTLADEVAKWPELGKKYAEKLEKLSSNIYKKGIEVVKCREDEFNVINHGDFWVNNMLFKYDDKNKPIDHIFVDFQICLYTTPAIDLHYFLNTSPTVEVIENHKKFLLDEYLNTLTTTMKQLGCKTQPPTMAKLQKSMEDRSAFAMIASFTVLPLVLWDKTQVKDLNEIMNVGGEYDNPAYKGASYRKIMTKRIPLYDKMGLLD